MIRVPLIPLSQRLFQGAVFCLGLVACTPGAVSPSALSPSTVAHGVPSHPATPTPIPSPRAAAETFLTSTLPAPLVSATPLPAATAAPTASPPPQSTSTALPTSLSPGRVVTRTLDSPYLHETLTFRVYLPPGYDTYPDHRYPVLYLLHGQGFSDDQWDRLGVDETAEALIASGQLAPFLIVMPRYSRWVEPTEYAFDRALVDSLLPWMETYYRLLPERQARAIGGLSRGGAWALHIGLARSDRFGAVGLHSGFVFHSDTLEVETWLDRTTPELIPRLYLDVGVEDQLEIRQPLAWLEDLLTQKAIPHEWHLFQGAHTEAYWRAHLEHYLRWYAEGWP